MIKIIYFIFNNYKNIKSKKRTFKNLCIHENGMSTSEYLLYKISNLEIF